MEHVWRHPNLAEEIIQNNGENIEPQSIISDILAGHIDILKLVENMAGVLTNKEAENRAKGMKFFTKILQNLPKEYLSDKQVQFISTFYIDRLKDHHSVIPFVLEGYLAIIDMTRFDVTQTGEFFTVLFREVSCQSQVRQDRCNIYTIIQKTLEKNVEYLKSLGPDFVYGFISAMEGERDPRNLLFLFSFLPTFLKVVPLGHLVEEMFDVISCYYPIDFHPSPDDPAAVSRQDLANALAPCICAVPEFGEQCMLLLTEKLDSNLKIAKMDSFAVLIESCKTFPVKTYAPFLTKLWSIIQKELSQKTDDEIKMIALEALSALIRKLATTAKTDQTFENFIKCILISMQTTIAECTTVSQFVKAAKVLLTASSASKESCIIITKTMIPAIMAYYEFKTSAKLQIASIDFLGDLYDISKYWDVINQVQEQVNMIPRLCLTSVSSPLKEYQIAGFRNLIRVKNVLQSHHVLPFIEILMYNVQHGQDEDLLCASVDTVHAIARKYPEIVMDLVVRGKCDLENLTQDKVALQKRLNLLSNLASIDDFTKIIISEMLKVISTNDKEAAKVITALNKSMSDFTLYSEAKINEIESDHGFIDSTLAWVLNELYTGSPDALTHGLVLISNTMSSLPVEKQVKILSRHTKNILRKCEKEEVYFIVLESLYHSVHQSLYTSSFEDILNLSLQLSLNSNNEAIRTKACVLIAHFLNKAEFGQKFELLYEFLRNYLSNCDRKDESLCPRLINLYGWIAKALIMRGSDVFTLWLQKIMATLQTKDYCNNGAEAIRLIMMDFQEYLTHKSHCRSSLLYKQRMYQSFSTLSDKMKPFPESTKEAYLLSWAYLLEKVPKTVLNNDVNKITPLAIESLEYDNKDLLLVMVDVLSYIVKQKQTLLADSLQTVLPRLTKFTTYNKSMDVRIKSLECLYDIASSYRTMLLLPYKQDMLINLAPSLDDKKRLVRNMAVKARTRWFLVGAPGEAKE